MTIREENFAGDLEYHPQRAVLYLALGVIAACSWLFSEHETKFTVVPLVVLLGSLTLSLKGIFLLRKSSEGLGLSKQQTVGFYHGGDELYGLEGVPGLWHKQCLTAVN